MSLSILIDSDILLTFCYFVNKFAHFVILKKTIIKHDFLFKKKENCLKIQMFKHDKKVKKVVSK